ncbi:glycerol-3-phosphate acyltransferase [Alkalihalobacillus sp. LMS6]|uniref:glycerol-3-phosphate acyltransferase n=1 Tax=Alkalihalobacillus sp. LMS6 TaxID=2924034 RepID=UPI0020D18347|nr:glycerol-3-phosphate acyltransferase [Alkalihalobacillus sp. LMS6]UTR07391.1 glycerol-3-phosphate acyltransferase [Alkalihalobacillus sp. LMS6]
MILFLYFFVAYAFGCLNGAYYIGKLFFKQDIRALGSKNAGARNIGRLFGRICIPFLYFNRHHSVCFTKSTIVNGLNLFPSHSIN